MDTKWVSKKFCLKLFHVHCSGPYGGGGGLNFTPTVTSSSLACWPGAMLENDHENGLATVQLLHFGSRIMLRFLTKAPSGGRLYSTIIQNKSTAKSR